MMREQIGGAIVLDKPLMKTSRAMCTMVRTRLVRGGAPRRIKVGHGGTLDPLATGVLVVLIGRATRLCEQVMGGTKEYLADIDLGRRSVTHDLEGEAVEVEGVRVPRVEEIREVLSGFVGDVLQRPPRHSAVKVDGRRSYALARAGEGEPLEARRVRIDAIDLVRYRFPVARVRIVCGKGVYVRSIARDLGEALGTGGMLLSLRRTRVGRFTIGQARRPTALAARLGQADLIPPGELGA